MTVLITDYSYIITCTVWLTVNVSQNELLNLNRNVCLICSHWENLPSTSHHPDIKTNKLTYCATLDTNALLALSLKDIEWWMQFYKSLYVASTICRDRYRWKKNLPYTYVSSLLWGIN